MSSARPTRETRAAAGSPSPARATRCSPPASRSSTSSATAGRSASASRNSNASKKHSPTSGSGYRLASTLQAGSLARPRNRPQTASRHPETLTGSHERSRDPVARDRTTPGDNQRVVRRRRTSSSPPVRSCACGPALSPDVSVDTDAGSPPTRGTQARRLTTNWRTRLGTTAAPKRIPRSSSRPNPSARELSGSAPLFEDRAVVVVDLAHLSPHHPDRMPRLVAHDNRSKWWRIGRKISRHLP